MEKKEFLDKILGMTVYCDLTEKEKKSYSYRDKKFRQKSKKQLPTLEDYLYIEWMSGGVTGGDCWGGTADSYVTGEPEPEFTEFDGIIELVAPDITFLKYKQLIKKNIIKQDSYSVDEYYGNSTNYSYKYIKLSDYYEALKDLDVI